MLVLFENCEIKPATLNYLRLARLPFLALAQGKCTEAHIRPAIDRVSPVHFDLRLSLALWVSSKVVGGLPAETRSNPVGKSAFALRASARQPLRGLPSRSSRKLASVSEGWWAL